MPRISVFYAGDAAKIEIASGEIIAGTLPQRALRLEREWMELHGDELEANWRRVVGHERPLTIPVTDMVNATEVQPLGEHWLRVTFTDGAVKEIDLSELLASGGGVRPHL